MKTTFFRIHDFLTVRVDQQGGPQYFDDLNQPFSYFQTGDVSDPDIGLRIGEFEPQNAACYVIDHKIHIRENYLYCMDRIGKTAFAVEIHGLESSHTRINASVLSRRPVARLFASLLLQNVILRPLLDFKLLGRQVLSVHACGAANADGALILVGRGGCFKTTIAMNLVRQAGYALLGDDRVLLHGKDAYSYPIHQNLFHFRVAKMKTERYAAFDKLRYLLRYSGSKPNRGFIRDHAPLRAICWLVKHDLPVPRITRLPKADVVRKTAASHKMENIVSPQILGVSAGKIYEYLLAYAYVFPNSKAASYWADYGSLAERYLNGHRFWQISVPRTYSDNSTTDQLMHTFAQILHG